MRPTTTLIIIATGAAVFTATACGADTTSSSNVCRQAVKAADAEIQEIYARLNIFTDELQKASSLADYAQLPERLDKAAVGRPDLKKLSDDYKQLSNQCKS